MAELLKRVGKSEVRTYTLREGTHRIGRGARSDIQITDPSVSSHHADIIAMPSPYLIGKSEYFIVDRDSRNGVFVNGDRRARHRLKNGDRIQIGGEKFDFVDDPSDSGDQTVIKKPGK